MRMDKFSKEVLQPKSVCGDSPFIRQQKSVSEPKDVRSKLNHKQESIPVSPPETPDKAKEDETNVNCSFPTEKLMSSVGHITGGCGDYESSPCAVAAWAAAAAAWLAARALLAVSRSLLPYVRQVTVLCRTNFEEVWNNDKVKHREVMLFLHGSLTFLSYLLLSTIYSVYTVTEWFVEPSAKKPAARDSVEVTENNELRTPQSQVDL